MLRMRRRLSERGSDRNERFGRSITLIHGGTVAFIAIMTLAAFFTLDRAIDAQHDSASAIGLADQERMLSGRVATLTAEFALGDAAVRPHLRAAIDALENTSKKLSADAPLDALAAAYVTRARGIVRTFPRNPSTTATLARLLLAAQRPLVNALDTTVRMRQDRAGRYLSSLRLIGAAIGASILATLLVAGVAVFRPMARRIVELNRDTDELAQHATVDPLTGMLNKRSFQARGAIEIQKARRYGRPLSLLMIDADQLPAIEGTYGTDAGETLLKALTTSFFSGTRVSDLVARVDAEQFAILLPETDSEGAQLLAERLRHKISDLSVPIAENVVSCTVSIGVAAAEKDASFLWPTFKRADEALYEAKQLGRNRVVVAAAA